MGNVFSMIRNQDRIDQKYKLDGDISTSYYISEEVDRIASQYILTQDAIEMLKLKDSEYYDNLVILTQDILLKHQELLAGRNSFQFQMNQCPIT